VADEAYEDVLFAPNEHVSIASLFPEYAERIVSVFSFSKSYAMSGLRTGYLVTTHPVLMDRLQKALRCSINGVNSVSQWTAVAAITGPQDQLAAMRDEYLVRRNILVEALKSIPGMHPFTPKGAFFVWAEIEPTVYARVGVKNADELSAFLAERGVGSAPGEAFGESCHDAIRFAFSCETKMVEAGAKALKALLA